MPHREHRSETHENRTEADQVWALREFGVPDGRWGLHRQQQTDQLLDMLADLWSRSCNVDPESSEEIGTQLCDVEPAVPKTLKEGGRHDAV